MKISATTCLSGVCSLLICAVCSAQEVQILSFQGVGATEGRKGDDKNSVRTAINFAGMKAFGGSVSAGGIDPNNPSALFGLLANESVRQELGLTEAQSESANEIMRASSQRLTELVKANLSDGKSMKNAGVMELMEEMKFQAEAAIEEILLPSQMKRIRQLAYQIEIAQQGLAESLTDGRLGTDIGVVDNQKTALFEKAKQIEAQARSEIIEIRKKARERLFGELTSEQRQKAEELLGIYFEYEEPTLAQRLKQSLKRSDMEEGRKMDKEPSERKPRNPR